jgi:antitoxin (DNA-binding transcriptional repressor) of toxin-antitoxin stability system
MVMKQAPTPEKQFRVVPAGVFKATCLQLMDEVHENGTLTIILTKRGKPVAQMTAPPDGLKLSGPTVELDPDTCAIAHVSSPKADAADGFKKHHKQKHKNKKKYK